jgi:hypothetical protein
LILRKNGDKCAFLCNTKLQEIPLFLGAFHLM